MTSTQLRWIHSFKTALACSIAFAITRNVSFPVEQWIFITIFVVMCAQPNVGGMLQKSYMRFLGTLTGSIIAAATLILFGDNVIAAIAATVFAGFFFSFIATSTKSYYDSGTLGAATVAVILIGRNPTLATAVARFFEISLGILIATLVSQFVFPIHARTYLRRKQAETLLQLRHYYQMAFLPSEQAHTKDDFIILDESLSQALSEQRKLAGEAKRELFGAAFNTNYFTHSLWCEKDMLRCITLMRHALNAADERGLLRKHATLIQFHHTVCDALQNISDCLAKQQTQSVVLPDIGILKQFVREQSSSEHIALDSFIFCAELLIERLQKLDHLLNNPL